MSKANAKSGEAYRRGFMQGQTELKAEVLAVIEGLMQGVRDKKGRLFVSMEENNTMTRLLMLS